MSKPLLYLSETDTTALAPTPAEAVDLVAGAMDAIAAGHANLHHHVVHPRPSTGLSAIIGVVHDGALDLAGQKWVSESPQAGVSALLMLNDPDTGELHTLMGARGLTGLRTAAVSGACVRALAPAGPVALVGTGLQCRHHLAMLDALGHHEVRIAYRRRESMDAVLGWADRHVPRLHITACAQRADAIVGAGTVITMVTRGAADAHVAGGWLRPDALLLPVDFAHCIGGSIARAVALLATDHPATYAEAVAHGALPGYPATLLATGAVIRQPRPPGRVLIQNLGNAAADLAIANFVRQRAVERGIGMQLLR